VVALVLSCVLATRWLTGQLSAGQGAFLLIGTLFVLLSVAAGVCDVIEDVALLRVLRAFDSVDAGATPAPAQIEGPARWARAFALGKFGLLIVVLLFVTSTCGLTLGQLEHATLGA
jgi:hypothetical protein